MRAYTPKYPLERFIRIDPTRFWAYPNLYRDDNGSIISDNIMYAAIDHAQLNSFIQTLEVKIKDHNAIIELAYRDVSGNRWMFLLYSGAFHQKILDQLQHAYDEECQFTRVSQSR